MSAPASKAAARGRQQGRSKLASIRGLMNAWRRARTEPDREMQLRTAREAVLAVTVHRYYCLELCIGGPAVRVVGELSDHDEPVTAALEYRDWAVPWHQLPLPAPAAADLLAFARLVYAGE